MRPDRRLIERGIPRFRRFVLVLALAFPGLLPNAPLSGQGMSGMLGLQAGPITTGVHSEVSSILNTDWRTGMSAGVFAAFEPTPDLTVRANLLFSRRGWGFRMYREGPGLIPGRALVQSVEALMDVGLRVPWHGGPASARVYAGPVVGYRLTCTVKGSVLGVGFEEDCDDSTVGLETRSLDVGASVGAGIDLHLQSITVLMDGRYTYGLRNLNRSPDGSQELSSRAWSFTAGLGWPCRW
jgi:hypothetical protein